MRKYPLEGRAALRFGERDELVALDREARDPPAGLRFEIALPEGVQVKNAQARVLENGKLRAQQSATM